MKPFAVCALATLAWTLHGSVAENVREWGTVSRSVVVEGPTGNRETSPGVIELSHETLGSAAVGQPLTIRITVLSPVHVASLSAEVYNHHGLIVVPAPLEVAGLQPHRPLEWPLTVTPYAEGPLRFSVLVRGEVDGHPQAGQLSVPVQVGDVGPEHVPLGISTTDESGQPIIVLEAREY